MRPMRKGVAETGGTLPYFTLPARRPRTKQRWREKKTISGTMVMKAPAVRTSQLLPAGTGASADAGAGGVAAAVGGLGGFDNQRHPLAKHPQGLLQSR